MAAAHAQMSGSKKKAKAEASAIPSTPDDARRGSSVAIDADGKLNGAAGSESSHVKELQK